MKFKKPKRPPAHIIWLVIVLCIALFNFVTSAKTYYLTKDIKPEYMAPVDFMQHLDSDEVFIICKTSSSKTIQFQLRDDVSTEMQEYLFKNNTDVFKLEDDAWYETVVYSSSYFADALTEHSVIVKSVDFNAMDMDKISERSRTLLLLYLFGLLIIRLFPNGLGAFGSKFTVANSSDKRFSDVIGQDEILDDLKQYIDILHQTDKFKEKGVKQPNGILFTGPPGTGKTLIAKALAGEAKLPFIYFNSSSAIDMYVGMGARTVRNCFAKAKKVAPCILFIDELDAIGGSRNDHNQKSSEDNQTLLALLQELDGFEDLTGVLVIGATNCPEKLDPAIRRAGRFDRQICINPPRNRETRKQLLELYTKNLTLAEDVVLDNLAAQTQGMTGADIAAVCNEAAILGIVDNDGVISSDNFTIAIDKFLLKGNRVKTKSELQHDNELVAFHEAGHAVATYLTGGKITRISVHGTTSGVGGYVLQEDNDKLFISKQELLNQLIVLYAGRASEEIKFGKNGITPGASNDIQKATNIIETMMLGYGFDEDLGLLDYNLVINAGLVDRGNVIKRMQHFSRDIYEKSLEMLHRNYTKVQALAEALLDREELTGEEAKAIIESEDLHNE